MFIMSSHTLVLDLDSSSSDDIFIAALLACEEEDEELMTLYFHDRNITKNSDEERSNKFSANKKKTKNDDKKTDDTETEKASCLKDNISKISNDNYDSIRLSVTYNNGRNDEQQGLCIEKKKKRKYNKTSGKRKWVKYTNETRSEFGEFHLLFHDLLKDDYRFFHYFKMSSNKFYELLHMLQPEIESINTQFRQPISGEEKLSVALRYLATGDSFRSISEGYKLGQSTVRNAIYQVCDLIQEKAMPLMIPPPCKQQWEINEEEFRNKYNFPNCVGVLAGRHVLTEKAPATGSQYFNYRKSFSTVLLALIDPCYKFMVIDVQDYGKISSSNSIFTKTELGRKFLREQLDFPEDKPFPGKSTPIPHVAVADEAFPLSRNILRPFAKSQSLRDETKKMYNVRLNDVKEVSEKCFALLTKRFRVYERKLNIQPENLDKIITATCCLHNFLCDEASLQQLSEESNPPYVRSIEILAKTGGGFSGESLGVRNDFKNYFSSVNSPLPQNTENSVKYMEDSRV